jgi:PAS domain S-box-containing protein
MARQDTPETDTLHEFLEAAPDAIVVVDRKGIITTANELAARMFGYSPGELTGKRIEVLVPERYRHLHTIHREQYVTEPKQRPMGAGRALTGLKKDGSEFPIEISLSPLRSDGAFRVISIIRDLTHRLRSEAKFRGFLESAPDAAVVVNSQGEIVAINSLTEKMFGYSRDELLGKRVEMLVPHRYRQTHVGQRSAYSAEPRTRPMGAGRELTGQRKDGSEFPVEISLSPLETEEGTLVISIVRDVTQRRQAEAKFKGLLESAPDGIVVVDSVGRILIVNTQAERMFDYRREELVGKPVEILVPERYQGGHVAHRDGYFRSPKTRPMGAGRALMGRKRDGTEFPVEISLSPLETEQGTLVTSIIRDITDRRRAEEQIKASLREKEVLLKEIHHRVKNNLQVTSSLLKLQSGFIQDPQAREMFAESQNRIRSMALVHEKLYQSSDLSRIDFSDYIKSLTSLLFRSFGVDRERIALKIEGDHIFLSVETAVPCGLIVNELLSNCLKHAFPEGRAGEIAVGVYSREPAWCVINVKDNGVGLPKELDLEQTETLGLQLVRTLAGQLRAEVEVVREGGTEFRIRFMEVKP